MQQNRQTSSFTASAFGVSIPSSSEVALQDKYEEKIVLLPLPPGRTRTSSEMYVHDVTKTRFFQPISFHHSLDNSLIIVPNDQSSERSLSKLDRLEVIHFY